MDEFEPQAAQGRAHQSYIDAMDALREARESEDEAAIRRTSAEAAAAKREWHRLVRLAESVHDKRSR